MKTETPRTDELEKKQYNHICGSSNDSADLLGAACNEMADMCREIERENIRLRSALQDIADADYRGNRHPLSVKAFHALSNTSMSDPEPAAPASKVANPKDSLDASVRGCSAIDGQCASAWCDCERYKRAAIKHEGKIVPIMKDLRCGYNAAKRASEWWSVYSANSDYPTSR
jgi:hypothetical protein